MQAGVHALRVQRSRWRRKIRTGSGAWSFHSAARPRRGPEPGPRPGGRCRSQHQRCCSWCCWCVVTWNLQVRRRSVKGEGPFERAGQLRFESKRCGTDYDSGRCTGHATQISLGNVSAGECLHGKGVALETVCARGLVAPSSTMLRRDSCAVAAPAGVGKNGLEGSPRLSTRGKNTHSNSTASSTPSGCLECFHCIATSLLQTDLATCVLRPKLRSPAKHRHAQRARYQQRACRSWNGVESCLLSASTVAMALRCATAAWRLPLRHGVTWRRMCSAALDDIIMTPECIQVRRAHA